MGQAKERGSREQRVSASVERDAETLRRRQAHLEMRQKERRDELARDKKVIVVGSSPQHRNFHRIMMVSAMLNGLWATQEPE